MPVITEPNSMTSQQVASLALELKFQTDSLSRDGADSITLEAAFLQLSRLSRILSKPDGYVVTVPDKDHPPLKTWIFGAYQTLDAAEAASRKERGTKIKPFAYLGEAS